MRSACRSGACHDCTSITAARGTTVSRDESLTSKRMQRLEAHCQKALPYRFLSAQNLSSVATLRWVGHDPRERAQTPHFAARPLDVAARELAIAARTLGIATEALDVAPVMLRVPPVTLGVAATKIRARRVTPRDARVTLQDASAAEAITPSARGAIGSTGGGCRRAPRAACAPEP